MSGLKACAKGVDLLFAISSKPGQKQAMASHKLSESSQGHCAKEQEDLKGDLSELLEEVKEMYKTFLVESPKPASKDESESKKPEPWRSRTLERRKQNSRTSSLNGEVSTAPVHKKAGDSPQEWQETTNLNQCMRNILHCGTYKNGDRLSPEDEMMVRSVFQYHPKAQEKTGPGIDYIKVDQVCDEFTRCFWVVRVDGTAVDFSFHKCLKAKFAQESPGLVEQYGSKFTDFRILDLLQSEARRRGEKLPPSA